MLSVALALLLAVALGLGGCVTAPPPSASVNVQPSVVTAPPPVIEPQAPKGPVSTAGTQADYRIDAAYHLYENNRARIYPGVLPHFLYAIGVLEIQIDAKGNLTGLHWMRAPVHAPEVMAEIERTVRKAAPFPAPVQMGKTSYIETWLWDASGSFQLHTLSEGQGPKGTPRRPMPPNPHAVRVVSAPVGQ